MSGADAFMAAMCVVLAASGLVIAGLWKRASQEELWVAVSLWAFGVVCVGLGIYARSRG